MLLICTNIYLPLRSAPSHKSEMVSQILFGEKYQITDRSGKWLKVVTLFDNYPGWIDGAHYEELQTSGKERGMILTRALLCYSADGESKFLIEPGSEVCGADFDNQSIRLGERVHRSAEKLTPNHFEGKSNLSLTARDYLNAPYLWGGRSPSGIDCSGLVQMVYKREGIVLPRDSRMQSEMGTTINFLQEAIPGDLLFFGENKESINHVAMLDKKGFVIHASGKVRIDSVDHQGIFRADTGRYTHRLRVIKRIGK